MTQIWPFASKDGLFIVKSVEDLAHFQLGAEMRYEIPPVNTPYWCNLRNNTPSTKQGGIPLEKNRPDTCRDACSKPGGRHVQYTWCIYSMYDEDRIKWLESIPSISTAATHCDSMPICLSYTAVCCNYQPIWWDPCSHILHSYVFELWTGCAAFKHVLLTDGMLWLLRRRLLWMKACA